jgi:hypothetical protein
MAYSIYFLKGVTMTYLNLFDRVSDLKEKFKKFFTHKKKIKALENYSECVPFEHKDYLTLIKRCMNDGFLGEKESDFLTYMLEKYEINFLDWFHRTKWLKSEMQRLQGFYKKETPYQLNMFDMGPLKNSSMANVPFEVLAEQHRKTMAMRH